MDPVLLTLIVISGLMAILLTILSIQAFLVLKAAKKTLQRVDSVLDVIEHTAVRTLLPLTSMGGFMSGMRNGIKMFEGFVQFLRKNSDD